MVNTATQPTQPIQPQAAPGNAAATTTPDPYPTIDLMIRAFPDAERATLTRNLPYILKAMADAGFTSLNQLIAILATIHVETIPRFAPIREIGGLRKRYAPFFGRGYIQLTWRANYQQAERDLNIPGLLANPDGALDPVNASRIFMWYWKGATGNNPSRAAERGDWRGVRKAVNGGYNGWDKFSASVQRCISVFDRGIDPAAIGSIPVDGSYGLGCADPGAGTSRTIAGVQNPQTQGDALAYALGLQALDSQRSHEFRGLLNVASDPTILKLDAQKTFEIKGIADDLDGVYTCDEIVFYPLAPGGIQAHVYGYKPDPSAPSPDVFLHDSTKGIAPAPAAPPLATDGDFANPCSGNFCVSRMGWRPSSGSNHRGNDLSGSNLTIVASADGIVRDVARNCRVGDTNCGGKYGNRIFIEHNLMGKRYETRYAHLASVEPDIQVGAQVTRGQKLGVMGNTGRSKGRHLHYEIREGSNFIDPFVTIKPQPTVSGNGGPAVPFR